MARTYILVKEKKSNVSIVKGCPLQRERPYHNDSTASRLLSEVKHCRAWLVLRWGTTLESQVLFFCLFWMVEFCITCNFPSNASEENIMVDCWVQGLNKESSFYFPLSLSLSLSFSFSLSKISPLNANIQHNDT